MANITNNVGIAFSNSKIRPVADRIAQYYNFAKSVLDEWNATGMSSIITNNSGDMLEDTAYGTDGTDGDGRPVVDGSDLNNVITRLQEFITDMEANSNAKLNTVLAVAVNTTR